MEYIARSLVKIKSIPDWHLFISRMETKWTKWYAMTSHVIAYRSLELLFGTHTFHFNCFFDDFNCVFTQIRCLSRVLIPDWHLFITQMETKWTKWYAMTSHVIAYRSLELLFSTHTFNFNCFFEDFNCVFTQIRCLSRVLNMCTKYW